MSKTKPQDDFYKYVNEKWLSENTIPDGHSTWGNFQILDKKSTNEMNKIIDNLAAQENNSQENQFIVNLYQNYLNDQARSVDGINPILPIIQTIDNLKDVSELTKLWIELFQQWNLELFHNKMIESYFADSNVRALYLDPMSLGMSSKDFYEETHPRHQEIKQAYEQYINSLVSETQISFAKQNLFELVYNFELELSKVMLKEEEKRDPSKVFNEKSLAEINELASFINWNEYFNALGIDKAKHFVVSETAYLTKLNELVNQMSLDDLKDIMKLLVVRKNSGLLTPNLYEINFTYSSTFSGVKTKRPAKERAVNFVNEPLGEIISKEYIKTNFSQTAKDDVLEIVHQLIAKFKIRINKLDWMSATTKQKAVEKLEAITIKIGYPDKWEDFSDLEIKSYSENGSLFANVLSIKKHYNNKAVADIDKPVDRTKWHMYAQTVNAYYSPLNNEICFPAAILQWPFYSETSSRAENLGGIGVVIGHEVSHGFDDQGSQFDKDGNFNNWWLVEDHQQYSLRTQKVVKQYDQYQVNGHHVNGQLTLGENIGDLSGMAAALDIAKDQTPNDLKAFFESYARVWCYLITDQEANTRLATDPHSPPQFRTNGVVVNIDEFHEVYETKPGDQMYKQEEDRAKVW